MEYNFMPGDYGTISGNSRISANLLKLHDESNKNIRKRFVNGIKSEEKTDKSTVPENDSIFQVVAIDFSNVGMKKSRAIIIKEKSYDCINANVANRVENSLNAENIDVVQAAEEDIHGTIEKKFEEVAEEKSDEVAEEEYPEVKAEDDSEEKEEIDAKKMVSDVPARIDFFDQDGNPKQDVEEVEDKKDRDVPLVVPERLVQSIIKDEVKKEVVAQEEETKDNNETDKVVDSNSRATKISSGNFDDLKARIIKLESDNKALEEKVNGAENEVEKMKVKVEQANAIVSKSEEQRTAKLVSLQKYIESLENKNSSLEQRKKVAQEEITNLSATIDDKNKISEDNYDEIGAIEALLASLEKPSDNEEEIHRAKAA